MNTVIRRVWRLSVALVLCGTTALFAEPLQQGTQDPSGAPRIVDEHNPQPPAQNVSNDNSTNPSTSELPDAPAPAQPVQQSQQDATQQQTPNSVPSGAAGAKAPTVRGAPASRPIGAAIAPTRQKQRRSLLIKAGLVAGAAVAVGSVFALSRGSSSRPPGAP